MKVLLITPEFPPLNIGGGGIVYENLSKQLKLEGHEVTVIAGNFSNKSLIGNIECSQFNGLNVKFVPLLPFPKSSKFNSSSYTLPTLKGAIQIIKEINHSKEKVIHLHAFCHPMIDIAAFTCIFYHKKYVITCHGIPKSPEAMSFSSRNLFKIYLSTVERIVVRKASALTAVSNVLMRECATKKLTNQNTIIIPNGSNTALKRANPDTIINVEKKYALNNKKLIFAVGRLSPIKGFQFLVDAMQLVVTKVPDSVAIIAGSGPYKESLAEMINKNGLSGNIKLIGPIDEETKAALYERSEAVVFPSLNEPFGIVILEALMMHKPIIAFNTESSREIIQKGTGLLVPTNDTEALANAIMKIFTDKRLREQITAKTFTAKFSSWQEIVNQYLLVYQKLYEQNFMDNKQLIDQSIIRC